MSYQDVFIKTATPDAATCILNGDMPIETIASMIFYLVLYISILIE